MRSQTRFTQGAYRLKIISAHSERVGAYYVQLISALHTAREHSGASYRSDLLNNSGRIELPDSYKLSNAGFYTAAC